MNKDLYATQGSLQETSRSKNLPMEEVLMDVNHMVLIDTSYSMEGRDAGNGHEKRHDVAERELKVLQRDMPGKIAVISFSTDVMLCPGGIPHRFNQGTDIYKALQFIEPFDGTGIKFYLISDGECHDDRVLEIAKQFQTPINCIFIGSEEGSDGRSMLREISKLSRGHYSKSTNVGSFQQEFLALASGE